MNPKFIMTSQSMGSTRWVAIARIDANLPESKARVSVEATGESKGEAIANVQELWERLTNYMKSDGGEQEELRLHRPLPWMKPDRSGDQL